MEQLLYNNYIRTLSEKFNRRLDDISGTYGFEYGIEFELAICEILRSFLPLKYGICRGFVVSESGEMAGDDIIIYDQERFPTLRINDKENFSRKEQIPIEAVYAYIEAKHTIILGNLTSKSSVNNAVSQVKKIKELCEQRSKIGIFQIDPHLPEFKNDIKCDHLPKHRNPIFTAIISRYVAFENPTNRITDKNEINKLLFSKDIDKSIFNPELIIMGKSNYLATGHYYDESKSDGVETIFSLPDKENFYGVHIAENLTYGLFLAYLIHAIDYIRLGRMPWANMINQIIKK
ncbi:DUF6602 domain-containing protein [Flavobacterium sp.]|uniref:DUF6602 domain-containing protein n=1 Tax=Flavobacterium sp. TaxID=239 RepID=UPI0037507B4A